MRTLKEIGIDINTWSEADLKDDYQPPMLEIMCNIALTLDKLYVYAKEINDEE